MPVVVAPAMRPNECTVRIDVSNLLTVANSPFPVTTACHLPRTNVVRIFPALSVRNAKDFGCRITNPAAAANVTIVTNPTTPPLTGEGRDTPAGFSRALTVRFGVGFFSGFSSVLDSATNAALRLVDHLFDEIDDRSENENMQADHKPFVIHWHEPHFPVRFSRSHSEVRPPH